MSKLKFPDLNEEVFVPAPPHRTSKYDVHWNVKHPNHYTWHPTGVECKDITQEFNYNVGSAMAYLWRHERKNGIEDLKKAVEHINFEIERLSKKEHTYGN